MTELIINLMASRVTNCLKSIEFDSISTAPTVKIGEKIPKIHAAAATAASGVNGISSSAAAIDC